MISLKTRRELELMRSAGRVAAEALRLVGEAIRPGISTAELDAVAQRHIQSQGASPTFLGYNGFPAAACISMNEEVIHGIPSRKRILHEGDIVGVDLGATLHGYIGDTAYTFKVGQVDAASERLCATTQAALEAAIQAATPGNTLDDIAAAVQDSCEAQGFGVVRKFSGHGVGRNLHEDPSVPNVRTGSRLRLREGMTLAIEPMVTEGTASVRVLPDGWTVITKDGKRAAHYEHTVAITANGAVILTNAEG